MVVVVAVKQYGDALWYAVDLYHVDHVDLDLVRHLPCRQYSLHPRALLLVHAD